MGLLLYWRTQLHKRQVLALWNWVWSNSFLPRWLLLHSCCRLRLVQLPAAAGARVWHRICSPRGRQWWCEAGLLGLCTAGANP